MRSTLALSREEDRWGKGSWLQVSWLLSPGPASWSLSPGACLLTPTSWCLSPDFCLLAPVSWLLSPDDRLLFLASWLSPSSCLLSPGYCLLAPISLMPPPKAKELPLDGVTTAEWSRPCFGQHVIFIPSSRTGVYSDLYMLFVTMRTLSTIFCVVLTDWAVSSIAKTGWDEYEQPLSLHYCVCSVYYLDCLSRRSLYSDRAPPRAPALAAGRPALPLFLLLITQ